MEAQGQQRPAVFAGTDDPDYRILLESVLAAQSALDGMKRFDMPGFHPGPEYVREMVRYGILPRAPDTPDRCLRHGSGLLGIALVSAVWPACAA